MRRVTDLETRIFVESAYGGPCNDLYQPETFSEWEEIENTKNDVYRAMWNSVMTFYDIYEMSKRGVFSEASPMGFDAVSTKDVVDMPDKQVTINKGMAYQGLPQVPPRAASSFLNRNMAGSDPNFYRYIGKGFFGALQNKESKDQGAPQPSNWVKEIRYPLQGRPIHNIIDPATMKPAPRLGAVTNRPIDPNIPQVPPKWDDYAPRKANAFTDPKTGQPYHGVYIGHADHIRQLETSVGERIRLTQGGKRTFPAAGGQLPIHRDVKNPDGSVTKQVIGYVDRSADKTVDTGRGYGIERGRIGADLRPPVLDDPSSYLGAAADSDDYDAAPQIPPMARGYQPGTHTGSNARQRQFGQYKWYLGNKPQLFDQRINRVLLAKTQRERQQYAAALKSGGELPKLRFNALVGGKLVPIMPTEMQPISSPVARKTPYADKPDSFGMSRDYETVPDPENPGQTKQVSVPRGYYRRMYIPDPYNPARTILAKPERKELSPEQLKKRYQVYSQKALEYAEVVDEIEEEMDKLRGEIETRNGNYLLDPHYKQLKDDYRYYERLYRSYKSLADKFKAGKVEVPKPMKIGTWGHEREPFTPEEIEMIKKGIDPTTGKKLQVRGPYVGRFIKRGKLKADDQGKNIKLPTNGIVNVKKLPNAYNLVPARGKPIVVSDNLRRMVSQYEQSPKGEGRTGLLSKIMSEAYRGSQDDKVFAKYYLKYGLAIQNDGTLRSTKNITDPTEKTNPWSWLMTDKSGEPMFYYRKDDKEYKIPVYLPGVIDNQKPNNPTAAGGWDATRVNSPELRPYRDTEKENRSIEGTADKETGKIVEGWKPYMLKASQDGVRFGLSHLLKNKFKKQDPFGNTGKEHYQYKFLKYIEGTMEGSAYAYYKYNLANGKALDLTENNTAKIDNEYTKRTFLHFYAALKQLDQWLNKTNKAGKTHKERLNMAPNASVFDLSLVQIASLFRRMSKYPWVMSEKDGQPFVLFQTKIRKNYIKDELKGHQADRYVKPFTAKNDPWRQQKQEEDPNFKTSIDLNSPKDRSTYSATSHKVDYNYLNVTLPALRHLFDEARRQYWIFAAKDMVQKMYNHMNSDGTNLAGMFGDDLDNALAASRNAGKTRRKGKSIEDADAGNVADAGSAEDQGGSGEGGPEKGPSRNAFTGQNSISTVPRLRDLSVDEVLRIFANRKKKEKEAEKDLRNNQGSLSDAAAVAYVAASKVRTDEELAIFDRVAEEAERTMKHLSEKERDTWIMEEFEKRLLENQIRKEKGENLPMTMHVHDPSVTAEETPQEYFQRVEKEGVDENPMWKKFATDLFDASPDDFEGVLTHYIDMLKKIPRSDDKARAERTTAYTFLKRLAAEAPSMDQRQRGQMMSKVVTMSRDFRTLYDVGEVGQQILKAAQGNPPPATPDTATGAQPAKTGLGSRLKRKTG